MKVKFVKYGRYIFTMSISSQSYWSLIFELYLIFKYSKVPNFAKEMSVPLVSSVLDNYWYLYPSWIGTDPTINIGCNVLLVSNSNHSFKRCAKGYFTYIFIDKNLINYVNAVMPIFCQQFDWINAFCDEFYCWIGFCWCFVTLPCVN